MADRVEVVRRAYARIRAGDLDGFVELLDPDVEFTTFITDVHGRRYSGLEGARAWQRDLRESFASYEPEPLRYEDFGDLILVTGRLHLRGTTSDVPVEMDYFQVLCVRGSRVAWWRTHRTRADAEAAHGLAGRKPVSVAAG